MPARVLRQQERPNARPRQAQCVGTDARQVLWHHVVPGFVGPEVPLPQNAEHVAIGCERFARQQLGGRSVRFCSVSSACHAAGCTNSDEGRVDEKQGSRCCRNLRRTGGTQATISTLDMVSKAQERKGLQWLVVADPNSRIPAAAGRHIPP